MAKTDHPSFTDHPVARLTCQQLEAEVENLRLLADRLQDFINGGDVGWTTNDTLATHQLAVRVQSHVSVMRSIDSAEGRVSDVVRLDDRR